jgi:hypothetical protein
VRRGEKQGGKGVGVPRMRGVPLLSSLDSGRPAAGPESMKAVG